LLKSSTIKLYASLKYGQSRFQWIFAQFSPADVISAAPVAVVRDWGNDIPVAMNLLAGGMGALMCYVGWRGQKIRSRLDIDKDIAELKGRRDRLQDWINR
jgi:hypothetical protein